MSQKNYSNKINNKELTYTQKCILLANIFRDKKKILINSFDNIPVVKLYTSALKQENFIYSKIKGALCFFVEEENNTNKYYLQIYDIKYYTLIFSLPINQILVNSLIRSEETFNFFCIPTKYNFLGFKFNSKDSMEKFANILACPAKVDKSKIDTNIKARDYTTSYKEIKEVCKNVKADFEKKFTSIDNTQITKAENEKDKNIFQKFDELYSLIKCLEYDEINNKFNLFIDRTINPKIIQSYIDTYKNSDNKKLLSLRIIFNDYTHIYNKSVYVDLLTNNLINNFNETKRLIKYKKEYKKKHDKEEFEESKRVNCEQNSNDNKRVYSSNQINSNEFGLKRKNNLIGENNESLPRSFTSMTSKK